MRFISGSQVYSMLLGFLLYIPNASAGEGGSEVKDMTAWGTALFLCLTVLPYFIRLILPMVRKGELEEQDSDDEGENYDSQGEYGNGRERAARIIDSINQKVLVRFHPLFGVTGLALGILHGFLTDECNIFLQLGMGVYGYLGATGIMLYHQSEDGEEEKDRWKRYYLLHTNHISIWLLLILMALGHIFMD